MAQDFSAIDKGPASRRFGLTTSWQLVTLPAWCTGVTPHNCAEQVHVVLPGDVGDPGDDPASGTPSKAVDIAAAGSLYIPLRLSQDANTAKPSNQILIAAGANTPDVTLILTGG